jgi:hypothetical protein
MRFAKGRPETRYLFLGIGIGVGLGLWSIVSILIWESYRPGPARGGQMPIAQNVPAPEQAQTEPSPMETAPRGAPTPMSMQPPTIATRDTAPQPMRPMMHPVPKEIPNDLINAPDEWIGEELDEGAGVGFSARLSTAPPAIRIEQCKRGDRLEGCEALIAGKVVELLGERVTLLMADGSKVNMGWSISGGRLMLKFNGREMKFRPGRKPELLKLLNR